jgi:hypothetical protein
MTFLNRDALESQFKNINAYLGTNKFNTQQRDIYRVLVRRSQVNNGIYATPVCSVLAMSIGVTEVRAQQIMNELNSFGLFESFQFENGKYKIKLVDLGEYSRFKH